MFNDFNFAATGFSWTINASRQGSSAVLDSGSLSSKSIVVTYNNATNVSLGDSIKLAYTSNCGLSANKSIVFPNPAVSAPLAPASIKTTLVSDNCGARIYRYTAATIQSATNGLNTVATGYAWSLPIGNVGSTGVLDSGTGANTLAARDLGLAGQYNLMRQQANEQDAQGLINERNATRQSATAFGNLQSQQAEQQGNSLLSSLAGISSGGGAIGQLGLGAGSLGVNLGSLGNQQQQLDLANRQQAFNEALAALGTNVNAQQTQLGNVFTGRNNYWNLESLQQQMKLNDLMAQMAGASGKTDWSKLIGGVAGGALGALGGPVGSAVGSQIGSGIGGMF
jgi:uncharacterized membrane protein